MNPGKSIFVCSTSNVALDRRIIRISLSLYKSGYNIIWAGRKLTNDPLPNHIQFISIDTFFKRGIAFYLEFNIRLIGKLFFNRKDYNAIMAVDLDTILAGKTGHLILGKKLIFDAHEYFSEVPELSGKNIKKAIWRNIGKFCINNKSLNYTVNDSLANVFKEKYKAEFHTIRNLPAKQTSVFSSKKQKALVYLGVLNKGRGLEVAIRSLVHLPEYNLKLVGGGDIEESLINLATNEGVNDRVEFKGWLHPDQLFKELAGSFAAINLLEARSESYRLSLANKFFDYIQAGIPSINMNFPEYANIIRQHEVGILLDELSVKAFTSSIALLENNKNYEQLISNCKNAAELYCWENEENKLLNLYSEFLD